MKKSCKYFGGFSFKMLMGGQHQIIVKFNLHPIYEISNRTKKLFTLRGLILAIQWGSEYRTIPLFE